MGVMVEAELIFILCIIFRNKLFVQPMQLGDRPTPLLHRYAGYFLHQWAFAMLIYQRRFFGGTFPTIWKVEKQIDEVKLEESNLRRCIVRRKKDVILRKKGKRR